MRIQDWKQLDRKEFQDLPQSFEKLLRAMNRQFEDVTTALQNGLTSRENLASDTRIMAVKHGVEGEVEIQNFKGTPTSGDVVYADNFPAPKPWLSWRMAGEKRVKFICYFFNADGTVNTAGEANVRLEFRV